MLVPIHKMIKHLCKSIALKTFLNVGRRRLCVAVHFPSNLGSLGEDDRINHSLSDVNNNNVEIEFNWDFIINEKNRSLIKENILNRKGVGNIDEVIELYNKLKLLHPGSPEHAKTKEQLQLSAFELPNMTHSSVPLGDETKARVANIFGFKREFDFKPRSVVELGKINEKMLHTSKVAEYCGPRAYHMTGELADLESALVQYTCDYLIKNGFDLMSVPDFVPTEDVVSSYGMLRLQNIGRPNASLQILASNMPLWNRRDVNCLLATASRCYRAETSDIERERGLYRVHQFTKVEMFGVTSSDRKDESDSLLEEFLKHQINLFSGLGLHFRVLDMPSQELGASAYRKFDIETWLHAKEFWGEISSTSNCTDYQSRRLNIRYKPFHEELPLKFCHTVNGTACAVPRMLIAIMEANQQQDGSIIIPQALIPYMGNKERINTRKDKRKFESSS